MPDTVRIEIQNAAVEISPTDRAAWSLLGDALFEAQRYEEAEKSYRTALDLDIPEFIPRR